MRLLEYSLFISLVVFLCVAGIFKTSPLLHAKKIAANLPMRPSNPNTLSATNEIEKTQVVMTRLTGKVYDPDSLITPGEDKKIIPKILFNFEKTTEVLKSQKTVKAWFRTLEGKHAVYEEVWYKDNTLQKYTIRQHQVKHTGSLEVKAGKVFMSFQDEKKKCSQSEEIQPNLLIADQVPDYVLNHWEDFLENKTLSIRFIVLSRCESIGFDLKVAEISDKNRLTIKMRPSSFFIAIAVNPILFTFDKKEKKLLEIDGRLPVKQVSETDYSDWEAVLRFDPS